MLDFAAGRLCFDRLGHEVTPSDIPFGGAGHPVRGGARFHSAAGILTVIFAVSASLVSSFLVSPAAFPGSIGANGASPAGTAERRGGSPSAGRLGAGSAIDLLGFCADDTTGNFHGDDVE